MNITLLEIFKAFFKIGLILLGGGYVIVPVMNDELSDKRNWLTKDEIIEYYCICQCLNGIIAINMAIISGYKLMKFKGTLSALLGLILSPVLTIIIIAQILNIILGFRFIQSVFWGVNLSVIVLIYLAIKDVWQKSVVNSLSAFWFVGILFLSLLNVSPVILLCASIFIGVLLEMVKEENA
ncbi:chromate transporter [bacterium]|nr:chromate transporter [bacterium]